MKKADNELSIKIWKWIEEICYKLGNHSKIIICTDANGHVGKGEYNEIERETCGTRNADATNNNGKIMLDAMTRADMVIVNTFHSNSDGKTYFTKRNGEQHAKNIIDNTRLALARCDVETGEERDILVFMLSSIIYGDLLIEFVGIVLNVTTG